MAGFFKQRTFSRRRGQAPRTRHAKAAGSRRARAGRVVLIAVCAALLVLPVLLIAHPVSYVPLVATVLLVFASWLYLQVLRRSLTFDVGRMAGSCERGQDVELALGLSNSSILPFPRIEAELFVTDLFGGYDDTRTLTCSLGSRESTRLGINVSFAHLGTYRAGVGRVVIHDLLGLFNATFESGESRTVTVQPRKVNLGPAQSARALPDESRSELRPVAADDVDYAGVREYRFGDPMKTVHWNLSSRTPGDMYTRLFETHVNPTMAIVIDRCAPAMWSQEDLMSLFDGMVEVAVALAAQAREAGIEVELRYVGRDGEPEVLHFAGASDAEGLVSRLASIAPEGPEVDASAAEDMLRAAGLRSHGAGNVVYVGARPGAELVSALADISLRRKSASAFVAVPRSLEGKERARFFAPLRRLSDVSASYYAVESNEVMTEVCGI